MKLITKPTIEELDYEQLFKRNEQFRKALCAIAYSSHCIYEKDPDDYLLGVADGHRCAAKIAKDALNEDKD